MSIDKAVDSTQLDADLTSVANAIRTKGGTSAQLAFPAGFVSAVEAIPSGSGGGTRLPAEYQEVEYLDANDSNAYIITDYVPVQNDMFYGSVYQNAIMTNISYAAIYQAGLGTYASVLLFGNNRVYYKYFSNSSQDQANTTTAGKWLLFSCGVKCNLTDLNSMNSNYVAALDGASTKLTLFNNQSGARANAKFRLGQFVIQNGSTVKLNLIPCYRKADTVIGMYDLVSDTFYTNVGNGAFLKGDDVSGTDDILSILLGGA